MLSMNRIERYSEGAGAEERYNQASETVSHSGSTETGQPLAASSNGLRPDAATTPRMAPVPELSSSPSGSVLGADGLPQQKIFPGIVHETIRRGRKLSQLTLDDNQ